MSLFTKEVKKEKPKELVPSDVYIKLENKLDGQKLEEYNLAKELGLYRQAECIKLEAYGFQVIRRNDCRRLLKAPDNMGLSAYDIASFAGKIPMGILCKLKELKELNIFDKLFIVAPTEQSVDDPLLIGEKFTKWDKASTWYDDKATELGNRDRDFWRRDSIVMLIAQWV